MMQPDPIIKELREVRKKIEQECESKGQSYYDHLLELQKKYKDRLVVDTDGLAAIDEQSA